MGDKHLVRFEPVGIEIEVDEDQTILRAASEQGLQLMHGCKEGQCAACKSFVLEGDIDDIDLDKYSTFALPDMEREEGQTLLCRAHAYNDLVIELLNYDEEIIRSGLPLRKGTVEVLANDAVTHDMRHLVVKQIAGEDIKFFPGQYMDLTVPDTGEVRSFSMANLPNREGVFEFVIKIYPDGAVLAVPGAQGGDRRPPRGRGAVRHVHPPREPDVGHRLHRRRRRHGSHAGPPARPGGEGRRPQGTPLLRRPHEGRPVLRGRTACPRGEDSRDSSTSLPCPHHEGDGWDGETGLITEVVRDGEPNLEGMDAYVCGPPPMVDAAIALLTQRGMDTRNIFYDKFTTTGEPEDEGTS